MSTLTDEVADIVWDELLLFWYGKSFEMNYVLKFDDRKLKPIN